MKQALRKAVMAVIVHHGKVLIGSSPRDGGYKFPQGGLESNEHYLDGITRELNEELGIQLEPSDIQMHFEERVGYDYPDEDRYIFKRQELHVVLIRFHERMKFIPQDDEFDQLLWILPEELVHYPTYFRGPAYQQALKMCQLIS